MEKNIILLRDNGDFDYIYGAVILKGDILDLKLLQNRLDEEREILGYDDYNGDDIIKSVIEKYDEYKDLEYISYNNYNLEI